MHGFNPRDDNSGAAKGLETEHRSRDAFDGPVVLLDDIVVDNSKFVQIFQPAFIGECSHIWTNLLFKLCGQICPLAA